MSSFLEEHIVACRFQLFIVFYGIVVQYVIQLLLCIRRWYALKTLNIGNKVKRLENNKYKITLLAVLTPLVYETVLTISLPHEEYVEDCSPPYLYGKYYRLFIGLNIAPSTVCLTLNVVLYVHGAVIVWKQMRENGKVHALIGTDSGNLKQDQTTRRSKKPSIIMVAPIAGTSGLSSNENSDKENSSIVGKASCIRSDKLSLADIVVQPKTDGHNEIKQIQETEPEPLDVISKNTNENTNGEIKRSNQAEKTDWEINAFVTCILIALQTTVLTAPLLTGFWYEVLSGQLLDFHVVLVLTIPYLLNNLSNPIIYYWRIPEIRQSFASSMKCRN